jgi:arylsulfatase
MPTRPNLIFLMPDQLRPDFTSAYGAQFIDTPNIDFLCQHGVRFTQCYSEHPVCVPARVSLMTGLHALKTGVLDNGQFLRPDHRQAGMDTWPEILSEHGYYTAGIGKMHFYPWDLRLGYQRRVICEDKRWIHIRDDYWHYLKAHGERKYHGNEHEGYFENRGAIINRLPYELQWDYFVGMEAARFIRDYGAEGPFAMMVGFPGPHCPYDPDARFLKLFDPEDMPDAIPDAGDTPQIRQGNINGNKGPWNGVDYTVFTEAHKKKIRAHYAALVKQIDEQVGEILSALRDAGQLDNTVILFGSDHGDYLGDHSLIGKGHYFESSWHVPMLAYLPWAQSGSTCNDLVTLTDVTATMLHFAGLDVPAHMDSRPLPALGIPGATGRDHVLGALGGGWAIYDGVWRLSKYATGEALLFNLREDPMEQRNLIGDPAYARIYRELDGRLIQEVMRMSRVAFDPQRVYVRDLSQETAFGREGWVRPYPRSVQER